MVTDLTAPSTPAGFQESCPLLPPRLRFLSLFNSGLVWTKWVWLKECVGLCQSGIAGFPLPICPCLFFSFSFFSFCFSTPFNQTERMRRLYPRWLHAGVHLNWICLVLGWLILGGRPFTAAGLSQTTQTRWPRLKFQVRIKSNNQNQNQNQIFF